MLRLTFLAGLVLLVLVIVWNGRRDPLRPPAEAVRPPNDPEGIRPEDGFWPCDIRLVTDAVIDLHKAYADSAYVEVSNPDTRPLSVIYYSDSRWGLKLYFYQPGGTEPLAEFRYAWLMDPGLGSSGFTLTIDPGKKERIPFSDRWAFEEARLPLSKEERIKISHGPYKKANLPSGEYDVVAGYLLRPDREVRSQPVRVTFR